MATVKVRGVFWDLELGSLSCVTHHGGGRLGLGAKSTPTTCPSLLPRAPCSTLTWLTATYHPHLQQARTLSRESLSSRGPRVPLHLLQAWRIHWMEPTLMSRIQTWHLLPSSACARPRAHGTGASRWYVTHILCRLVCLRPVQGPAGKGRMGRVAFWPLTATMVL